MPIDEQCGSLLVGPMNFCRSNILLYFRPLLQFYFPTNLRSGLNTPTGPQSACLRFGYTQFLCDAQLYDFAFLGSLAFLNQLLSSRHISIWI